MALPGPATREDAGSKLQRLATASGWALLLGLALVAALAARLAGLEAVLDGDQVHLIDPDSHYHAWRMIQAAEAFPALPPLVDPLIAHPQGYLQVWPPGFDYLGGALATLGGLSLAGEAVARLGTLLVVLLGAMTVIPVALLARRVSGSWAWAALAGLFLAIWPIHLEYSRIGRLDHHVMEPLVVALLAWLTLAGIWGQGAAAARKGRLVLAGVILGTAFWLYPSAATTAAIFAAGILGYQLTGVVGKEKMQTAGGGGGAGCWIFAVAALVVLPLALLAPYRHSWELYTPSPLHPLLLASVALASLWLSLLGRILRRRQWPRALRAALATAGSSAVLALPAAGLLAGGGLNLSLAFAGREGLWGLIFEQRSLWELPGEHLVLLLTFGGLLAPLPIVLALFAPGQLSPRRSQLWLLASWTTGYLTLGALQLRFLPAALALAAPLLATSLQLASARLSRPASRLSPRWLSCGLSLLWLALFWPAADYIGGQRHMPSARALATEAAARWLRRHPLPESLGVLAPLGAGHALVHLGRVPVVGSPLVAPSTEAANLDTLRFFTARDPAQAAALVRRRQVGRVLVLPPSPAGLASYRAALGERPAQPLELRQMLAVRLAAPLPPGDPGLHPPLPWLQLEWEGEGPIRPRIYRVLPWASLPSTARDAAPCNPAPASVDKRSFARMDRQ